MGLFPVSKRFINLAKESTSGTAATGTYMTAPMNKFDPEDKVTFLEDDSWRGAMAGLYDLIEGVKIGDLDMGGPVYADLLGHLLLNILGDYTATGSGATNSTTLSADVAAGATTASVTSGTGYASGQHVQLGTGATAEIVTLSGVSGTTLTFADTPARLAHTSGAAAATVVAPFTHVFSLYNGGDGQPPTHTFVDHDGVTNDGNARLYAYTCLSELTLTGNAEQLFTWEAKATALASDVPDAEPSPSISTVRAQAAWNSTVTVGGSANQDIGEWEFTLTRKVDPYYVTAGSQNPHVIGRGAFTTTGKLTYSPAEDESALTTMLSNTQPELAIVATNSADSSSLTLHCQKAAYDTSKLNAGKSLFGYDVTHKAIATTDDAGWSLGYSPIKATLINSVPTY